MRGHIHLSGNPVPWDIDQGSSHQELFVMLHTKDPEYVNWAVRINRKTLSITHITAGPLLRNQDYRNEVGPVHFSCMWMSNGCAVVNWHDVANNLLLWLLASPLKQIAYLAGNHSRSIVLLGCSARTLQALACHVLSLTSSPSCSSADVLLRRVPQQ